MWALPAAESADEDGVVGIGADLAPGTLVDAYRRGIFPWPHRGMSLPWFSPDPRAIVPLDGVHVSRSMRRRLRTCGWHTTMDVAFDEVVRACADRRGADGTWITSEMVHAYLQLHHLGWAHSLEVWDRDRLVGGIYGVQVGAAFTGESMFHRTADASKVALVDLVARMREAGGLLFDVQLMTEHLRSMGAVEVRRAAFLQALGGCVDLDVEFDAAARSVARLTGGDVHRTSPASP
ncbi:MAG: leucyl/phenylalanyl-tRNA--protein transferase [Nitriliruptoraceae bacterium]